MPGRPKQKQINSETFIMQINTMNYSELYKKTRCSDQVIPEPICEASISVPIIGGTENLSPFYGISPPYRERGEREKIDTFF